MNKHDYRLAANKCWFLEKLFGVLKENPTALDDYFREFPGDRDEVENAGIHNTLDEIITWIAAADVDVELVFNREENNE